MASYKVTKIAGKTPSRLLMGSMCRSPTLPALSVKAGPRLLQLPRQAYPIDMLPRGTILIRCLSALSMQHTESHGVRA